jgi:death-on-curing protein
MKESEWLANESVLEIHEQVINVSGGTHGLRNEALMEFVLSHPQHIVSR